MRIVLRRRSGAAGLAVMLLLAGCAGADQPAAPGAAAVAAVPGFASGPETAPPRADAAVPADVAAFRERRDACDHFRGEDPYDAERAAFLSDALARTCTGTDAELKALRTHYGRDPRVLALLAGYEDAAE